MAVLVNADQIASTSLPDVRPDGATASVLVAQNFTSGLPALGLGVPLPLRGGDSVARERLTTDLGFGWQAELRDVLDRAADRATLEGRHWLSLPALLLCGPKGVGRTHVARRIAELAGVPHVSVTVGGPFGIEQLRPTGCGPDLTLPSAPVLAIAVSQCANPIVTVAGIDTLDASGQDEIARMLDPATAERWVDYPCRATVNLRHVNWMIQSHDPSALAPSLLRLVEPVWLRPPEGSDVPLHLVEVLAEAAIDRGVVDRLGALVGEGLVHLSRNHGTRATADIYVNAIRWLDAQFGR